MHYTERKHIEADARRILKGERVPQSQESLEEQLEDLRELANKFGLYDAADWIYSFTRTDSPIRRRL